MRGGDGMREVPQTRWNTDEYYDPDPDRPGRVYTRRGGFLDDIEGFDPQFFGISPREAAYMDPQQRLLLETTWEAFEDAGIPPGKWAGRAVGVFVGLFTHDYENLHMRLSERGQYGPHSATGMSTTIAANRISHAFDFNGPSMVIDTACSSSLVAVHLACQSLHAGEARLAVAGGVNLQLVPEMVMSLCQASMLSPDGRCKSFDARANGYARADGVGMVVLKPLADALADGDPVYAVILGGAVNQDGRSSGITVPNGAAQKQVMRAALDAAGVAPAEIGYVEAHGTGTPVGDPIEARALGEVLCEGESDREPCAIGSVKSNFGHTESAAGVAGLIKVALMLRHGQIPANLHFETPNPEIPFAALRLRVPTALEAWSAAPGGRRAGINSFGFGGTNAHLVVGEAPPPAREPAGNGRIGAGMRPTLLCLSARSTAALRETARRHADFLRSAAAQDLDLADIAAALALGREHHPLRLAVAAATHGEAADRLEAHLAGQRRTGLVSGAARNGPAPGLAFVFSGMGQQWWAMGRDLLERDEVFAAKVAEIDALFAGLTRDWSLLSVLKASEDASPIDRTELAQPAIFALQAGLAAMWAARGVRPAMIVGHSIGEVAAAHVAGALDLADAVTVCFHRARLQATLAGRGGMLAVGLAEAEARRRIAGVADIVCIAAVNSPRSVTLAGDAAALRHLAETLTGEGVFARLLNVEVPYHSPAMDEIRAPLRDALAAIAPVPSSVPLVSTVTGSVIDGAALDADYWTRNVREPVAFADAMGALAAGGCGLLVEMGAHPVLASSIRECLQAAGAEGAVIASLRRGEADGIAFLDAVGQLHVRGCPLDLDGMFPPPRRPVALPSYPWQRAPFWTESELSRQRRTGLSGSGKRVHPLLGVRQPAPQPTWLATLSRARPAYLADHRVNGAVVFPAAGYAETALAAAAALAGDGDRLPAVERLAIDRPLVLGEKSLASVQLLVDGRGEFAIHASTGMDIDSYWVRHATGRIAAAGRPPAPLDLAAIGDRLAGGVRTREDIYAAFARRGLDYGEPFRNLETAWRGEREALGKIVLTAEIAATLADYHLHPALLDTCFQLMAMLPGEGTFLPVGVGRIAVHGRPGPVSWAHVCLVERSPVRVIADIDLADPAGVIVATVAGLACRLFEEAGDERRPARAELHDRLWVAAPAAGAPALARAADFLPPPSALGPLLQERHDSRMRAARRTAYYRQTVPALDELATAYFVAALTELGCDWSAGAVTTRQLEAALGVSPRHARLLRRMLELLCESGLIARAGDGWLLTGAPASADPHTLWQRLVQAHPDSHAELALIQRCGSRLALFLRDEDEPLTALFPPGSPVSEHLYADSPTVRPYNQIIADAVSEIVARLPDGEMLRILEVGAGTGALASWLLPLLPPGRCDYVFSDISPSFVNQARERFRAYPFVRYQTFDLEEDPAAQGFAAGSFDLILTSDTLHATADLRANVSRLRGLLVPAGLLALLEITALRRWGDLVFGLLPGWWLFADHDVRPDHPTLPADAWRGVLATAGFADCVAIGDRVEGYASEQSVILARATEDVVRPVSAANPAPAAPAATAAPPAILLADGLGVADALAEELRLLGRAAVCVPPGEARALDGDDAEAAGALLDRVAGAAAPLIVDLRSLTAPGQRGEDADPTPAAVAACARARALVAALVSRHARGETALWFVTSGAQVIGSDSGAALEQAPLWGFVRTVMTEHYGLNSRLVDLGPVPDREEIAQLARALVDDGAEDEIVLRGARRYVGRIVARRNLRRADGRETAFVLKRTRTGSSADLAFQEAAPGSAPGPGEVCVRMCATGLNFKDVAILSGLLDDSAEVDTANLGLEGAGIVTAVGAGVSGFAPGDEVMGTILCSLSNPAVGNEFALVRKPANLSFEEAAGIPVVFLTAWHALRWQARLAAGETVLVHSAAGGLGLAAIQVARHLGAEVLATAGSAEKRAYLEALGIRYVGDSRSTGFVDEVLRLTGGKGVDVVLNTLPAEKMEANISVLRPATGRLIDLANIHYDARLDYRVMVRGVSVAGFDLLSLGAARPDHFRDMLHELAELFEAGSLRPVPYRTVPLSRAAETIHAARRAAHIGKNVVDLEGARVDMVPGGDDIAIAADGSYLVSGGLSGFGLSSAQWLAARGARHLVLVGRRGAETPEAAAALAGLRALGVQVEAHACDVGDGTRVAALTAKFGREWPPLRGVVHAAGLLRDRPAVEMTGDDLRAVMAPKATGAWNLHRATLDQPLDFFVCTSSATNLIGNHGQANYGAANEFIEALIRHRHARGLPGLAVGLGAIRGTGIVARDDAIRNALRQLGVGEVTPAEAWAAICHGIRTRAAYLAVSPMDWKAVRSYSLPVLKSPRFALLGGTVGNGEAGADGARRAALAAAATPQERRARLAAIVVAEVAGVLGMDPERLDVDRPLPSLGFDSLMAVELMVALEKAAGLNMTRMELLRSDMTTAELIAEVAAGPDEETAGAPAPADDTIGGTDLAALGADIRVEDLSDSEVDALLQRLAVEEHSDA